MNWLVLNSILVFLLFQTKLYISEKKKKRFKKCQKNIKKCQKMPLGGDIQDWFNSLPFFTRYWFGGTVLFTLLGRFGLLPASWLVLAWEPLWYKFQIWRPISAIFYYPLTPRTGFHFLINLYFLYNYSLR